jgi:hypothetical protein
MPNQSILIRPITTRMSKQTRVILLEMLLLGETASEKTSWNEAVEETAATESS